MFEDKIYVSPILDDEDDDEEEDDDDVPEEIVGDADWGNEEE